MTVPEKITALRAEMAARKIDLYIIPTSDFHESEYVGEYFKVRQFLTGFTGSAGTAVVTAEEACLWTDARYFVQAGMQLRDSGITLMKMGEPGVPEIQDYIREKLPKKGRIGFDGRCINAFAAERYQKIAAAVDGDLWVKDDLAGDLWKDRPSLPADLVWILEDAYSGESAASKLERIRKCMAEEGADRLLIGALYDIAWILNIRANDIHHVPVVLSFLMITGSGAQLFVREEVIGGEVRAYLEDIGVEVCPYDDVYDAVGAVPSDQKIWLDRKNLNCRLATAVPEGVGVIDKPVPSEAMKSVKNETELANTRLAHLRDGVAVTKFMYWLKKNVGKIPLTEYTAGEYLDGLRAEQEHFLDLSFEDICGFHMNGAIVHYQAQKETAAELKPEHMLLVDSGGHYLEGTTDITRTFILGPVTDEEKKFFTMVCISNMNLANTKFLHGCKGQNLDIIARQPFWSEGFDYKHGTGHGVGHILNVHEGPNAFRWQIREQDRKDEVLEPGMITTDEPGIYLEGKFGIRLENELLCVELETNEYGKFLGFEPLTLVPIDLDGIEPSLMSVRDRDQLNAYHKKVREAISPYLTEEEQTWLKEYTREI